MQKTVVTGQTCIGDLRLATVDIGFDIRASGFRVQLPEKFHSVGLDIGSEVCLVTGTREEMVQTILDAGYKLVPGPAR